MSKAQFERIKVDRPDTALFKISGRLGFHENSKVEKLVEECLKREFRKVVFDFLDLSSLGGGVARILREFVSRCEGGNCSVIFVVENEVVLDFLLSDECDIRTASSVEKALEDKAAAPAGSRQEGKNHAEQQKAGPGSEGKGDDVIILGHTFEQEGSAGEDPSAAGDSAESGEEPAEKETTGEKKAQVKGTDPEEGKDDRIISEIFNENNQKTPPEWINSPRSPFSRERSGAEPEKGTDINRQLKRRVLELETLFSISSDFNSIYDKKKFLDIFLLTSIAQGGIEAALFLECKDGILKPIVSKGNSSREILDFRMELESVEGSALKEAIQDMESLGDEAIIAPLVKNDFKFFYPFMMDNKLIGIFVIGKRISGRRMEREDFEFLNILANVAQGAYRNVVMLEEEHERTLGIVKTLITMIEENTLLKGTSEFVSRYVGVVAKKMNYPQEDFKDLIYGTVLRDMGMIKISDLIIKSPRELTKEEWDIVKRHPDDGARMLKRMKFSDRVVDIVRCHHERFNGEGYPHGLRGKEIPLGSRIISVVESYSAMIHDRPARVALSEKEALDTLKENYGLRYDMEVIRCFVRVMEKEIAKSIKPAATVSEG